MLNCCEQTDQLGEWTTADELRMEFSAPGFDPAHQLQLWEDACGAVIGFGQLWVHDQAAEPDSFLWYRVRPDLRDGILDQQIIAWGAQQTRALGHERGVQLRLRVTAITTELVRIAVLEQ